MDSSLASLVNAIADGRVDINDVRDTFLSNARAAHRQTNCVTHFNTTLSPSPGLASLLGVPVTVKDTYDLAGSPSSMGLSRNTFIVPPGHEAPIVRLLRDAGALIIAKTTVPTALLALHTSSKLLGHTTHPADPEFSPGASSGGGAALLAHGRPRSSLAAPSPAYGGAMIDIASDIGGSSRIPAHFCGLYSLKGSAGRFPSAAPSSFTPTDSGQTYHFGGNCTPLPGFDSIDIISAPMACSLDDLADFYERVVKMNPYKYDSSCIPLPWRAQDPPSKPLRWGIIWDDGETHSSQIPCRYAHLMTTGIVPLSPACARALSLAATALRTAGHQVVEFSPPCIPDGLAIANELAFEDGGAQIRDQLSPADRVSPGLQAVFDAIDSAAAPAISSNNHTNTLLDRVRRSLSRLNFLLRQPFCAADQALRLLCSMAFGVLSLFRPLPSEAESPSQPRHTPHQLAILGHRSLIAKRDAYRAAWHAAWADAKLDFVLTAVHPLPAFPIYAEGAHHRSGRDRELAVPGKKHGQPIENEASVGLGSAGLTFIFNLLDYTAGVVPVSSVDPILDAYPNDFLTSPSDRIDEPATSGSNNLPHVTVAASSLAISPPPPYPYRSMASLPPAAQSPHSVYFASGAARMAGMPLGVQVVGRRLEEERVLSAMKVLDLAVKEGSKSPNVQQPHVGGGKSGFNKAVAAAARSDKGHRRTRSTGHVFL
ncbi:hypothetical protein HGRIS_006572 [Hohenbuehelia grisea]|uniref:Amidase domain-containing protein n=1 Tax=Hohenbuehelia grisea TaxID=104357 RepID=A0ABR3J9Q3_9AGAR